MPRILTKYCIKTRFLVDVTRSPIVWNLTREIIIRSKFSSYVHREKKIGNFDEDEFRISFFFCNQWPRIQALFRGLESSCRQRFKQTLLAKVFYKLSLRSAKLWVTMCKRRRRRGDVTSRTSAK